MSEIYKFKPGDKPSDAEVAAAEEIIAEGEMEDVKRAVELLKGEE